MTALTYQVRYAGRKVSVKVSQDASYHEMQEKIFEATGVPIEKQVISVMGFPSKRLLLPKPDTPVSSLHIGKDDVLALTASEGREEPNRSSNRFLDIFRCGHREPRPSEASSESTVVSRAQRSDVAKARFPILDPELVDLTKFHREPVAGDNSCLFTAVIRSLKLNGISTRDLRGIVARTIEANPDRYTEAVLEQPPKKYAKWICKDTSWGGYIELSILAPHFGVQINTVGIMTGHFYKYPQDVSENTPCVYLLHDGAHYDYVASQSLADDSRVSIFSSSDARVANAAKGVAEQLRKRKLFTDFGGFTLQCQECFALVIGQGGAIEHSRQTGHSRFQEISQGL